MPGILPELLAGGLEYRDAAGNPTNPAGVERAYSPAPAFLSNCNLTALPSDCTARIEPKQINAIVSELIAFAECLDPNGPWDCASVRNLCTAFSTWAATSQGIIQVSDAPPAAPLSHQLWWESDSQKLFIFYDGQWVQVSSGPSIIDGGTF